MSGVPVVIVTPALADANNGNWRTARRWRQMLSPRHAVRITREWPDAQAAADRIMLALHARRSAPAIAAWAAERGSEQLAVVLTGTDLYRDILTDAAAQRSLALARTLVLLHELGPLALPVALRAKARVIRQSTTARTPVAKTARHLRALAVGHLRSEKDPLTLMAAARALRREPRILIDQVGAALDPALARAARAAGRDCPAYRWLGAQAHEAARRRVQRAHVLVHASRMEGGAHAVMEAVCSDTPVLASRIDGNVGMLGADYAGYFDPGDARALAALLLEARHTQASPQGLLQRLAAQCARRAPLFAPEIERRLLLDLVASLGTA